MAANDAYREYIRKLTACKTPKQAPSALARVLSTNLAFVGSMPTHEQYLKVLVQAETEFGGGAVVGVHIAWGGSSWQAAAVYRKNGTLLVVETKPVRFSYEKLMVGFHAYDVGTKGQTPLLFRLTAWLARSIFAVTDAKPFPILHKFAIDQLDLPPTNACLETTYAMPEFLRTMDMYVCSVALASSTQIDADETTVVDVLHSLGLVYVGSLNEAASENEGVHLRATLHLAQIQEGCDHLWWLEDVTLFEDDHYNLVVRFTVDGQPVYMKRRLAVVDNGTRFQDLDTSKLSHKVSWQDGDDEAGVWKMNAWVESLLPLPAKAMPYMRHEIIRRYHVLRPRRFLFMARPYLVNGVPGLLPQMHNSSLPPRLFYSPDLFVESEKIPPGLVPTTVLGEIHVQPWIMAKEMDMQLFLKIDGEKDHVYRILFTKHGKLSPDGNQVRIFVQSKNKTKLEKDAIQLVMLRRTAGPGGCFLVEFVFTSYCRPFTLCTDSMLCDFTVRLTTFQYDAKDEPVVFPPIQLMLWSNRVDMVSQKYNLTPSQSYEKTLQMVRREKRCVVPLIFAHQYGDNYYSFSFCEGQDMVRMKPTK